MKRNIIFIASYLVFLAAFSFINFQEREFDWDMPGYLGAVFKIETNNKKAIHDKVYKTLKAEVPSKDYKFMTEGADYRKAMCNNDEDFYRQIPYYSIKTWYVLLIFSLYKIGFSATSAVILPNIFAFFLSGLLLFKIFKKIIPNSNLPIVFSVLILLFPPMQKMSEIASPDMLALFCILWFFWNFLNRAKTSILFLNLMVLIAVRPDFSVFAILFYAFDLLNNKFSKIKFLEIITYCSLTFIFYKIILEVNDYPGWKAVFYDSFIHRRIDISAESCDFGFNDYWFAIKENALHFKRIFFSSLLMLTFIVFYGRKLEKTYLLFGIFLFANIVIKFLFFPNPSDLRFYMPFLLLMLLWCFQIFYRKKAT